MPDHLPWLASSAALLELNPSSIMPDMDGTIKIAGFGIARELDGERSIDRDQRRFRLRRDESRPLERFGDQAAAGRAHTHTADAERILHGCDRMAGTAEGRPMPATSSTAAYETNATSAISRNLELMQRTHGHEGGPRLGPECGNERNDLFRQPFRPHWHV